MCYVIKKQQKNVELTDKMIVELALCTEVPIGRPITIVEVALIIWDIQSRPFYHSELLSIFKIRTILDELILVNPRKIIELEKDTYLIRFV
ncbi:MAG: hypothetical protein ACTSVY_07805 [Candidatus Helarchaeota archaeon]